MSELRVTPVYRIGHQARTIMGGDPNVVLLFFCGGLVLVQYAHSLVGRLCGPAFILLGLALGRAIAKRDPHWRAVFVRSLRYRDYYPGRGSVHAPAPSQERWR